MLGSGTLVGIGQPFFVQILLGFRVLLTLGMLLRGCLLYLLLHFGYLGTGKNGADTIVHLIDHVIPHLGTLQFEDEQRVFLLVAGILY